MLSQQVPNMSSFLPPKASEVYRPLNYTPTSFVSNFKEMSQIDSNNNNNNNNNNPHDNDSKFSPRQTAQFSPMSDLRSTGGHDSHPFKQFQDDKPPYLSNNNNNGSAHNGPVDQDSIVSSLQSNFQTNGLPTSYTSHNNNNSMQTTLSSPSSITSNMSRSFSTSSNGYNSVKQESDEEDDGGTLCYRNNILRNILLLFWRGKLFPPTRFKERFLF